MFSKKKNISLIQGYLVDQKVVFKKNDTLFVLNDELQEIELLPQVADYFLKEGTLYYQTENLSALFILDLDKSVQHKIKGSFSIGSGILFCSDSFYVIGELEGITKLIKVNQELNVDFDIDYTFPLMMLCVRRGLIFKKKGLLINYDVKSNIENWSHQLSPGEKVQGIYQHEGILIIQSSANKLYGLDERTGGVLWELSDMSYYHSYNPETGLLYSYGGETYRVINAKEGKILIDKKFEGAEEKYRISPQGHMHSLSGDYLYFMSNWHESKFGAINIRTHEIAFVQDFVVEEGVKGGIPYYYKGRLYIKDSVDTLHIFERTA